jgi:ADP-ribosyl-[dinitrogen reductase] hydrolase
MAAPLETNSALVIDYVDTPSGGMIGLTSCPGRNGVDGAGQLWQRDLVTDLSAIDAWGAAIVVTLIETAEFAKFGIEDLPAAVKQQRFRWFHVPIPDMQPPNAAALLAWVTAAPDIAATLMRGERLLLHCAAGLGRTGTIAAKLLTDLGMPGSQAIELVRVRRPGAIETAAQEAFVFNGEPLLKTR